MKIGMFFWKGQIGNIFRGVTNFFRK